MDELAAVTIVRANGVHETKYASVSIRLEETQYGVKIWLWQPTPKSLTVVHLIPWHRVHELTYHRQA